MDVPHDDLRMLEEARARARKLVEGLVKQRDELALPGRGLTPAQIAEGKLLLGNALQSATRMLVASEDAWRMATEARPDDSKDE